MPAEPASRTDVSLGLRLDLRLPAQALIFGSGGWWHAAVVRLDRKVRRVLGVLRRRTTGQGRRPGMLVELHDERSFKKFVTSSTAWQSMSQNSQSWLAALHSQRRISLGRAGLALKRLNAACAVRFSLRCRRQLRRDLAGVQVAPWHFLYFLPLPQKHTSLRPGVTSLRTVSTRGPSVRQSSRRS
jgi:hypothetical protein